MASLQVILDGDNSMKDLTDQGKKVVQNLHESQSGAQTRAILLRNGTAKGKHTASLAALMPDGTWALIETTAELFISAAKAFEARIQYESEQAQHRN